MAHVPNLRSPYAKVGRLVYFGRMLDKIRLHAAGELPAEYIPNLGDSIPGMFDTRCCTFLRVPYSEIKIWTLRGSPDEDVLQLAEAHGHKRTDEECYIWNSFLMKRGWHDPAENEHALGLRIAESKLEGRGIQTYFDYIDLDEGRDSISAREWQKVYGRPR